MSSIAQSNRFFRLSLVSPCAPISLAAPTLARHLGISKCEAVTRLSMPSGTLSDRIENERARRLANLLTSLGVAVRLEPSQQRHAVSQQLKSLFDFSLQPIESNDVDCLAAALKKALPSDLLPPFSLRFDGVRENLAGPGGLILEDLTSDRINQIRRRLRRISGLRLVTSNKSTALYDIIHDPRISSVLSKDITARLKYLGLAPCSLTGAVASRVDMKTRDHVMKRFEGFGLTALNQDFQRFDLFLMGTEGIPSRELADFLMIRSDIPRHVLERMQYPLRIETGLTRANALAFQSDYAALGLETCARLRVYHPLA